MNLGRAMVIAGVLGLSGHVEAAEREGSCRDGAAAKVHGKTLITADRDFAELDQLQCGVRVLFYEG